MLTLIFLLNIYFVSFKDKPEKSAAALSPRAMEQRAQWNIPTDEMDYPVSPMYQNELRDLGVKIHHVSRWFNGATCEMDEETAKKVEDLSFVTAVEITRDDANSYHSPAKRHIEQRQYTNWDTGANPTDDQLRLYNLLKLHDAGFEGQGILMTVCDEGFGNADQLDCFKTEERADQFLGYFDFTDDPYDFFDAHTGLHGTACLSSISAIDEQLGYRGAATKAKYYLMRSEENDTESPKEMDNLVAALEKSDSLGVNVFSVSLGYYYFDNSSWNLPKSALNGRTTRASQAATIAARKGMLVCVAAGNEGNKAWRTISVPADADSILTVGAVDINGNIASFSSNGPSADGRVKPEVCAVGSNAALINTEGYLISSSGTSFATPLLAGMAASLWSALPKENAMQIRERIIRSADRYDNPDTKCYGYGIPDAWKAYGKDQRLGDEWMSGLEENKPQKIIRGDQILIIRHGHIYNLAGQLVE